MNDRSCLCCQKSVSKIKARGLCASCYTNERYKGNLENYPLAKNCYRSKNEAVFINNFFGKNNKWLFEPASFIINNSERYVPDFYDIGRNVWIEVCASRTRLLFARRKYKLFLELYPNLKFEVRDPDGNLINWNIRIG